MHSEKTGFILVSLIIGIFFGSLYWKENVAIAEVIQAESFMELRQELKEAGKTINFKLNGLTDLEIYVTMDIE